ncbi:Stromal cell-derived factor 2 [Halotydeus destructor]|nr:Stromal cell-derived factor 2 [Halotydeus destructor]
MSPVNLSLLHIHLILAFLSTCVVSDSLSYVTCGSVIKLINNNYKTRLHSHDIKYGSGSGQQSVTASDDQEDANSYWAVKGSSTGQCTRGEAIKCGSNVRLEHLNSGKNLHSHLFTSPLSGNQEISAFGESGEGDTGDNWTIVCTEDYWDRSEAIRLKHVDTEKYVSLSGRTYGRPISGQMEVVGIGYPDTSSYWKTAEGIFVKPTEMKDNSIEHDEL